MAVGNWLAPLSFVLYLIGLVLAGAGVSLHFKTAGQAFEERMETAGVLAVAAFAALLAFVGTDPAWESMEMVLVAMIVVALAGVVLVLLPKSLRMIAGGVLILIHFGGMVTAATNIDPPGSVAPWISQQLWVRFYRPYLQFMYLNNAYHFYSPEPGPPSVVWFHIKYTNGKVRWYKIPNRDLDPVPLHHTRLLSITESTGSVYQQVPWAPSVLQDIRSKRETAGAEYGIPLDEAVMPINSQYQEALPFSQKMIESYVHHVALRFPWFDKPDNTVQSIKVYRFRQTIIPTSALAEGRDPVDKNLLIGYYQGEYNKDDALLKPDVVDKNGAVLERKDPFRFWYMPIYYRAGDHVLVDGLTQHARLDLDKLPLAQTFDPNDSPWGGQGEEPLP